jgi:hypothetical protein
MLWKSLVYAQVSFDALNDVLERDNKMVNNTI